ncbi:MAG: hypothetical protein JJ911_07765 [Rhizobiaceae bacterium]|nr:hypothetical protein [Rhizobiaceae bacterium]
MDRAEVEAVKNEAFGILRRVQTMRKNGAEAAEEMFVEGLHFWAVAIARRIDHNNWDQVVWHANNQLADFQGDAIRFFENLFEGMILADGHDVWP